MANIIMVSIEATCLAFMLVIFAAYIALPHFVKLGKDAFFFCLICLTLGLIFDMISWACECTPSPRWLQYTSNTLCLMASGFTNSFFSYYIVGLIREKKSISWNYARVITIVNLCGTVIVLIAAICGKLYEIVPNPTNPEIMLYFGRGFLYDIPNYLSMLTLIVLFAMVLINAKVLGREKIIVFSVYFVIPLLAASVELLNEALQFSYAATCVNMSIVYVILQSKRMNDMRVREELLKEWSYVDSLTGLLNRRAFERDVEEVGGNDLVNIAFCDLNGLKKINDEKGHQEGDRYLIGFSEMLTRHFSRDCVYRISGDEFVVITQSGNKEFDAGIKDLRQEIDDSFSIASLGTINGLGENISNLLKEAEVNMYYDKENYYRKNPSQDRRRSNR